MIDGIDLARFYSYVMERFDSLDWTIVSLEDEVCWLRAKNSYNGTGYDYDVKTRKCKIKYSESGPSPYDGLEHYDLYINGMWYSEWENL